MDKDSERRDQLLLRMYTQMFDEIKTQFQVTWQSVTVLASAFALFALAERNVIPFDYAAGLVILIAAWLAAHTYNACYWYNRNLAIIANIEKQFLRQSDLKDIHYYFAKHREPGRMIMHLRIQWCFAVGVGLTVLFFHFTARVASGFGAPWRNFEPVRALPYIIAIVVISIVAWIRRLSHRKYTEFLDRSPGREVHVNGIAYGPGHPAADCTPRGSQGNDSLRVASNHPTSPNSSNSPAGTCNPPSED